MELIREEPAVLSDLYALQLTPPSGKMVHEAIALANDPPFSPGVVQEDFLTEFVLSADRWIKEKLGLDREREKRSIGICGSPPVREDVIERNRNRFRSPRVKEETTMKGKGKRLFSLAIAFLLAVMAPISAFAAWVNPFTDVKPGAWHYEAVEYVNTNYLFSGTAADKFWPVKGSNGKLLPQRTDARAQTSQIFYNAHELLASPVVKLQAAGCFALSIRWYCLCWYCQPWSEFKIQKTAQDSNPKRFSMWWGQQDSNL